MSTPPSTHTAATPPSTHTAALDADLYRALLHRGMLAEFFDHGHRVDASIGKRHSIGHGSTAREALADAVAGLSAGT
jgi:hypothetical protein